MSNKRCFYLYLFLIFLLNGCTDNGEKGQFPKEKDTINVAAAANVQFAMKKIEAAFEKKHGVNINIIIGSSGKLTAQIMQGAPYHIFLSANEKYPNILFEEGFSLSPKIYALGSLVAWTMYADINLDEGLSILKGARIKKIAIANPKNAPYGAEALNVFDYFSLREKVQAKLVFAESIAQTNQYILSKNCEVGITAKSVVVSPEVNQKGHWIEISKAAYQPIAQAVVITKIGAKKRIGKTVLLFSLLRKKLVKF